jgi:AcrR family transcriptional regulator
LNRRSAADRSTTAIIRDAAMELFAQRGASAVTVREIASAAGVSPGLVIHHFGSKDGLRAAVDRRAAEFVDSMLGELMRLEQEGGSASLAEVLAEGLAREPALTGYVRRLLLDGGDPADDLFQRLFATTLAGLRRLEAAGLVRAAGDERIRAAFLLANDLAVMLLRPQIVRAAGVDPLAGEGVARWAAEAVDVYTGGLFVASLEASEPAPAGRKRGSRA